MCIVVHHVLTPWFVMMLDHIFAFRIFQMKLHNPCQCVQDHSSQNSSEFSGIHHRLTQHPCPPCRYTLGVTHELHQEGTSHTRDNRSIVVGRTSTNFPILMATPAVEYATFSPLVAASLHALSAFDDATFRKHLPDFFPLMTKLIRAEYAPTEVHRSLAELFLTRIGPLLDSLPPPRPAVQTASPSNLQ